MSTPVNPKNDGTRADRPAEQDTSVEKQPLERPRQPAEATRIDPRATPQPEQTVESPNPDVSNLGENLDVESRPL